GARPAALDDVHAQAVKHHGHPQLVRDRQVQPDLLRPVPQRRVIDLDPPRRGSSTSTSYYTFTAHDSVSSSAASSALSHSAVVLGAPAASTAETAVSRSAPASGWPRWASISAADSTAPAGLARPWPAMSGADP